MAYPVILTPQAQDDLRHLVREIAGSSPEKAKAQGNLIIDRAVSIGLFPEMGRVAPELGDPGVREIVDASYRIIYEQLHDPAGIFVLRFGPGLRGTGEPGRR